MMDAGPSPQAQGAHGAREQAGPARVRSSARRGLQRLTDVRAVVRLLAVALSSGAAAAVGAWGEPVDRLDVFAWPASGVACALLVVLGSDLWPGVVVGTFVAAWSEGFSLGGAAARAWIDAGQACAIAALLPRLGWRSMSRLKDVLVFLGVVPLVVTLGASAGAAALVATNEFPTASFGAVWRSWWSGSVAGSAIVTAFVCAWREPACTRRRARRVEVLAMSALSAGAFWVLFGALEQMHVRRFELPALWFVVAVLVGARFAQRGAATVVLVLLVVATVGTVLGSGPFVEPGGHRDLAGLSAFMSLLAATSLLVGAAVAERDAHALALERSNAELREALDGRDTFLSVASHELRTPLGALVLQLELLVRGREVADSDAAGERLSRAYRQVRRMKDLVDRLFDVSKIRTGSLELERERLDLVELVRDVAARFEGDLLRVGSTLHVDASGPVWGEWDGGRLDQVLSNLLVNAAKYGKGSPVEVAVRTEGDWVKVSVRDHGIGIAPEDQGRIFSRFEKLASERQGGGLGLGLWICDQLVSAMGGIIRVTSAPSRGSIFIVELPLRSAQRARVAGGDGDAPPPPAETLSTETHAVQASSLQAPSPQSPQEPPV